MNHFYKLAWGGQKVRSLPRKQEKIKQTFTPARGAEEVCAKEACVHFEVLREAQKPQSKTIAVTLSQWAVFNGDYG